MSHQQNLDTVRLAYANKRGWMEACNNIRGRERRPEHWFTEQASSLEALEKVGRELAFIVEHADAYDAWKAFISKREKSA